MHNHLRVKQNEFLSKDGVGCCKYERATRRQGVDWGLDAGAVAVAKTRRSSGAMVDRIYAAGEMLAMLI